VRCVRRERAGGVVIRWKNDDSAMYCDDEGCERWVPLAAAEAHVAAHTRDYLAELARSIAETAELVREIARSPFLSPRGPGMAGLAAQEERRERIEGIGR
jgi:hypothetical protein